MTYLVFAQSPWPSLDYLLNQGKHHVKLVNDKDSVWVPSAQEVFLLPYVFNLSLENS